MARQYDAELRMYVRGRWRPLRDVAGNAATYGPELASPSLYDSDAFSVLFLEDYHTAFQLRPFLFGVFVSHVLSSWKDIVRGGVFYLFDEETSTLLISKHDTVSVWITESLEPQYLSFKGTSKDNSFSVFQVTLDEATLTRVRILDKYELPLVEWTRLTLKIARQYCELLAAVRSILLEQVARDASGTLGAQTAELYAIPELLKRVGPGIQHWLRRRSQV